MHSLAISTIVFAALVNALPSSHKHGHSHARRGNYDLSSVDWNAIDWSKVFGNKVATPAPAPAPASAPAPAPAPAVAASNVVPQVVKQAEIAAIPAVNSAAQSSGGSSGKRGLAWDQANDPSLAKLFDNGKSSWTYNWGSSQSFSSSMQYVPMIKTPADFGALSTIAPGSTVLGFNEPDHQGLSPAQAAAHFREKLTPLRKSGAIGKLVGPAITNGGNGLPWLQEFVAACADCAIDALAVHWYGPDMPMFEAQMSAIHAAFPNSKLWVTEIGCTNWNPATNPSAAQVSQFMSDSINWLESTDYIEKYSHFGSVPEDASLGVANEMLTGRVAGSTLTDTGKKYTS